MRFMVSFGLLFLLSPSAYTIPPDAADLNPISMEEFRGDDLEHPICQIPFTAFDPPGTKPLFKRLQEHRRDGEDQATMHIPTILVEFDDHHADQANHNIAYFNRFLNADQPWTMKWWYLKNSYDQFNLICDIYGWYHLDDVHTNYISGPELAYAAVELADDDIDFSRYDNDGDGLAETVMVIHAGARHEYGGNDNNIHAHAGELGVDADGVYISRYSVSPEVGGIAVHIHENGHAIFGLPDLYGDYQTNYGIGRWSMMGRSDWSFDPWCKARCGFLEPVIVRRNMRRLTIPPVELQPRVYALDAGGEYFLVENRQQIAVDFSIPGPGLLVYHLSGSVGNWEGAGDFSGPRIVVVEADGNYDISRAVNWGDDGDPFPGSANNHNLTDDANPNSRTFDGVATGLAVTDIQVEGQYIICNLLNGIEGQNFRMDSLLVTPERVIAGREMTIRYYLANDGNRNSDATNVRILLSNDAAPSEDDLQLGDDQVENPLAPDGGIARVIQRTMPQDIVSGSYYVLVYADPSERIRELAEDDNVRSARVLVGGQVNLEIQTFSVSPEYPRAGGRVTLAYRVANVGGESANDFTLEFYLSNDALRSPDDLSLGNAVEVNQLDAGGYIETGVERTIPHYMMAGRYYILAIVDRQNRIREIDENDNIRSALITIPGPNLRIISAAAAPTDLRPGEAMEIRLSISNRGILDSPASNLGVALSYDTNLSNNDWSLGDYPLVDSLPVGDTLDMTIRRVIPDDVWTRNWHILLKADCFGRISEIDEDDNVFAIPVRVTSEEVGDGGSKTPPSGAGMLTPHPNPTNSSIIIDFALQAAQRVEFSLLNIRGERIGAVHTSGLSAGGHSLTWNLQDCPAGVYVIKMRTADYEQSLKVVLVR